MTQAGEGVPAKKGDLGPRALSAIVMASAALFTAWWGGWPFKIVWVILGVFVFHEWLAIVTKTEDTTGIAEFLRNGRARITPLNLAGLFAMLALAEVYSPNTMMFGRFRHFDLVFLVMFSILTLALIFRVRGERGQRLWLFAGFFYALVLVQSVVLLRLADPQGLAVILFLFAIVWGADVGAYFAGRALGGPKLAPRISPNKTWSGFCGGILAGVVLGLIMLAVMGIGIHPMHALIAALLALASVAGDLFESHFKRRFGVKDSGHLIPGHGGFMDRLDGFIFAAAVAALIGVLRGGVDQAGAGLLVGW